MLNHTIHPSFPQPLFDLFLATNCDMGEAYVLSPFLRTRPLRLRLNALPTVIQRASGRARFQIGGLTEDPMFHQSYSTLL